MELKNCFCTLSMFLLLLYLMSMIVACRLLGLQFFNS